ncbi:MAG: LruC domain-containing protein [Bacteroidota bacterium]
MKPWIQKFLRQSCHLPVTFSILLTVILGSCEKKDIFDQPGASNTLDQFLVERLFNWSMVTRNVGVSIKAVDILGNPLPLIRFEIYTASPQAGGLLMFSGCTDDAGRYETTLSLPAVNPQSVTIVTTNRNVSLEKTVTVSDQSVSAIFEGLVPDTTRHDSDLDGVPDIIDDYPQDTLKAFNNYIPSKSGFNRLIFEDTWPNSGDYDFNDMVISYRFNLITNALNQVIQLKVMLVTEAAGTLQHNGFGFQMPLSVDTVFKNVSGTRLNHGIIEVDNKGFETGQKTAVVIAFDDAGDTFLPPAGGMETNTIPGGFYATPDSVMLTIDLIVPIPVTMFGAPPFNPFIFLKGDRTREVHLPDYPPTDKADTTVFGTSADNSQPGILRFYKSRNNLPWALHLPGNFRYMKEGQAINTAYLKFKNWAEKSGWENQDWYFNTSSDYLDNSLLYSH